MNKEELIKRQAAIRDQQRWRIDGIHQNCHAQLLEIKEYQLRNSPLLEEENELLVVIVNRLKTINEDLHVFLTNMDEAIIIHGLLAELDGRDPKEVTRAMGLKNDEVR